MKNLFKKFLFMWNIRRAVKFIDRVDRALHHHPRWKRKQFWRDFITSEEFRKECTKRFPEVLK